MRRLRILTPTTVIVWTLSFGAAAAAAAGGLSEAVLLGLNSVHVQQGVVVASGDVVVNDFSPGPTLVPGFELALDRAVTVAGSVRADSVALAQGASVAGTVACNDGSGVACGGLFLPVFAAEALPSTRAPALGAGAVDVVVGPGQVKVLAPGQYLDVTLDHGSRLVLTGGTYDVGSIRQASTAGGPCGAPCRAIEFRAPTVLRVLGRFDVGRDAYVGPGAGASASAASVLVFVAGSNFVAADPGSQPAAAAVGQRSTVAANFWVPNGTFHAHQGATLTGAFLARDVRVDRDGRIHRSSIFNPPPTATPQDVFTSGTAPLSITLTGSDPEGEPLSFSIVSQPARGALSGLTPLPPASAAVTYTAAQAGDLADAFTFRVTDPNGGFGDAVVSVNPRDPGEDPAPTGAVVAKDATHEAVTDVALEVVLVALPDVADPGAVGDLEFSIVSGPAHGTLAPDPPEPIPPAAADLAPPAPQFLFSAVRSASVIYTPESGFAGTDSFVFRACGDLDGDGDATDPGECDDATVTLLVGAAAPPAPPVAASFEVATAEGAPVEISLVGGGSDGPGEPGDGRSPDDGALADEPRRVKWGTANTGRRGSGWSARKAETPIVVGAGWSQTNASPPTFLCFGIDLCEDGPFTFTVETPACVSVTDVLLKGDQYRVFDNGVEIGVTSFVPKDADPPVSQGDPNLAFPDPTYSSGTFVVGPGSHSIALELTGPNAFTNARGYLRVDPPDTPFCQLGPPLPDLVVSSLVHAPASPDTEDLIAFTATVRNLGEEAAGPSRLCFEIAGESCAEEPGATLFDVPALEVGEAFDVVRRTGLSEAGTYQSRAQADFDGEVEESDESNNGAVDTVVVTEAVETPPIFATIRSLPSIGTLFTSTGSAVTVAPTTLSNAFVTYQPPAGFTGTTFFNYTLTSVHTGLTSQVATVGLMIGGIFDTCVTNAAFCDDGR